MKTVKVGIIGGGLMGKEVASAFGRWFALSDFPVKVELTAVCDLNPQALEWYRQIHTVELLTTDYKELLSREDIEVVYVALPHHLHRDYYVEVLEAGKDLLGEKPFGIDLAAAREICAQAAQKGRFVRCVSEMPFLPGPQRVIDEVQSGRIGQVLDVKVAFLHSSDLDPEKPVNWKRQVPYCGEIGVMADLGMHVMHIPLRLGWKPEQVFAILQKIITERPDGKGGRAIADTWNNATLLTTFSTDAEKVPLLIEMKRLSPGETNSWLIEINGTEGGVRYNTKDTKALWTFRRGKDQVWQRTDLGFEVPFPTVTGKIFEPGFSDGFMQMLAAYFVEREGQLEDQFHCLTPEEVVSAHSLFDAALKSHLTGTTVSITY
ncbi:MAG: Gfo/Idh/MocA family oxidoreductase [Spirosomataceae bacterium]